MASVPVDERTKARLQRLRERIERETGRRVDEARLLERIVEREFESAAALVDSFRDEGGVASDDDEFKRLSNEEVDRWLSGTAASGNPVPEDEIDRLLYGEARPDSGEE